LLNQTINLLGAAEIKTLTDLENLLEGKTLKELKESYSQALAKTKQELTNQHEQKQTQLEQTFANTEQDYQIRIEARNQEINKIATQLDKTKEKLIFYTENLKTKESIIAEYQQEVKDKDQNFATLQNQQENLEKQLQKEKSKTEKTRTAAQENINLAKQKIVDLENNLLALAKQKLTNQKQAKALVEQIETEWQAKQTN
jgi:hypothetical protein